jgi:hypothetical protein
MLLGWLDSERLRLLDKPRPLPAGPAINEAARKGNAQGRVSTRTQKSLAGGSGDLYALLSLLGDHCSDHICESKTARSIYSLREIPSLVALCLINLLAWGDSLICIRTFPVRGRPRGRFFVAFCTPR